MKRYYSINILYRISFFVDHFTVSNYRNLGAISALILWCPFYPSFWRFYDDERKVTWPGIVTYVSYEPADCISYHDEAGQSHRSVCNCPVVQMSNFYPSFFLRLFAESFHRSLNSCCFQLLKPIGYVMHQWRTQEFCSGGGGSTNSVEDREKRERGSGS